MAKISKDCAKQLALVLAEKNRKAWWVAEKALREAAHSVYKKFVPKEVMELFEKRPEWIEITSHFHLRQNGWNGENINFEPELPNKRTGPYISPNEKDCEYLRKLYDKSQDLQREYRKLLKDIENALLLLGTTSKVMEAFPQSVDFINQYFDVKHLPAVVNIESIRQRLK